MEYILRVAVHEDAWQRQLGELLELCARTPIREVMLMEESHQILTSPFPRKKHERMAAVYACMAEAFAAAGVRHSVNLVTCAGHGDNRVPARLMLPFQRFVGEDLAPAHAVYCIADEAWVEYTAQISALYASTRPARLMLDDDFRSLNHTASYGCFCETHARLVSRELGYDVTPLRLRDAACGLGPDAGEVKAAWMRVNFAAQLRAAKAVERAVHAVSPKTQVGLMNSGEPAHSVQGRDMDALLRAFSGGGQCLSRPLGGAYSDALHTDAVEMLTGMSLSMAAVHSSTFWASEVENYPNTPYTKSAAVTQLQMQLHALAGADGLTLNLHDYLATPLPLQREYAEMVCKAAPAVEAVQQLRRGKTMRGVGLPWRGDAALHRQNRAHTPDGMLPARPLDAVLPLLGVPVQFTPAATNVLLGDDVLCYKKAELEAFLRGGLMVDNIAAEHLCAMGFAPLLGCAPDGRIEGPCVEQISSAEYARQWAGTLLCTDWEAVRREGAWITRFAAAAGAQEICRLLDEEKQYLAPALIRFENALGGIVCVLAAPVRTLGWLCRGRAALLRGLLRGMPGCAALPFVEGDANLAPFYYEDAQGGGLLGLVNCGLDDARAVLPDGLRLENALDGTDAEPLRLSPVSVKFYRTCPQQRRNKEDMP